MVQVDRSAVEGKVEQFREAARKRGIKLTHQRLEILRAVAASLDHPSADAVFKALSPRMPTLSLDTVYRTLRLLHDLGLVSTLGLKRESLRFDANLAPHHHYICVRCGLVRDFQSTELSALRVPASMAEFGTVGATHVEVRGVCSRCSKEQAAESQRKQTMRSKRKGRSNDHE